MEADSLAQDEARYRELMSRAGRGGLVPLTAAEVPALRARLGELRCARIDYEMEQDAIKGMTA